MPAAVPCKTPINGRGKTCRSIGQHKTKHACIAEADESMRIRSEELLTDIMKTTSQEKA